MTRHLLFAFLSWLASSQSSSLALYSFDSRLISHFHPALHFELISPYQLLFPFHHASLLQLISAFQYASSFSLASPYQSIPSFPLFSPSYPASLFLNASLSQHDFVFLKVIYALYFLLSPPFLKQFYAYYQYLVLDLSSRDSNLKFMKLNECHSCQMLKNVNFKDLSFAAL